MTDPIWASSAPDPVGAYPHAKWAGNLLFLSGVGPREQGADVIPGVILDSDGNIQSYDIVKQCHSVFRNVRLILEQAGSAWENLLDITVFLTDMKQDFAAYNQVYAQYFQQCQPTRTTVEVVRLPTPIAIELKCIAVR